MKLYMQHTDLFETRKETEILSISFTLTYSISQIILLWKDSETDHLAINYSINITAALVGKNTYIM